MYVFCFFYEFFVCFGVKYLVDVVLIVWNGEIVFGGFVVFLNVVLIVVCILNYVYCKVWFKCYCMWVVVVVKGNIFIVDLFGVDVFVGF